MSIENNREVSMKGENIKKHIHQKTGKWKSKKSYQ